MLPGSHHVTQPYADGAVETICCEVSIGLAAGDFHGLNLCSTISKYIGAIQMYHRIYNCVIHIAREWLASRVEG